MKPSHWRLALGITLSGLSLLFYLIHYAIFRDARQIFLYLISDIGFLFIQVLLVTLIIDEAMSLREKRSLMEKLNMVIGAFYSEVGVRLLGTLAACDPGVDKIRRDLIVTVRWTDLDFRHVKQRIGKYGYEIDIGRANLTGLKDTMLKQRTFLLRLLENPNLLEHDSFTKLLMAVFHLTEELAARSNMDALTEADSRHIEIDMKRAYSLLAVEWLDYMKHLKNNYPYLFSFAMRTNPFDPEARPEIVELQ
jgi:hypothetical protein